MTQIPILNDIVEGECKVRTAAPLRYHSCLFYVIVLLSIMLLGLPLLFLLWFPKLRRKLYYSDCSDISKATHFWISHSDGTEGAQESCSGIFDFAEIQQNVVYFETRFLKYYFKQGSFRPLKYSFEHRINNFAKEGRYRGLSQKQAEMQFYMFGQGRMKIQKTTFWMFLYKEMTKPFFLFVVFCVVETILIDYALFGLCILAFNLLAMIFTIREYMEFEKEMEGMLTPEGEFPVLRAGNMLKLSNKLIVPGDIVFIQNSVVPFDGIVVEGAALINQSSLTGESFPVSKKQLDLAEYLQTRKIAGESIVSEGTTVLQWANPKQPRLGLGLFVVATSFSTYKGQIIRAIKFPKNSTLEFEREGMIYVLGVFLFIVLNNALLYLALSNSATMRGKFIHYTFMALAIAVPSQLPTSMIVAAINSLKRLKKQSVFSNNISKIIENGKINMVCFDKTGTLTRKDMYLCGYIPYQANKAFSSTDLINKENRTRLYETQNSASGNLYLKAFGCCHSLQRVISTGLVDGDPLEVQLFRFSGLAMDNDFTDPRFQGILGRITKIEAGGLPLDMLILRRFQFNSDDKKMSTICFDNLTSKMFVFSKGSPEEFMKISSVPSNFLQVLNVYTQQGLRVLGFGYKEISPNDYKGMLRKDAENGLTFLGLMIFENQLKQQSPELINTLMKNGIRCIMLTGDNKETAVSIGKQLNFRPEDVMSRCTPQEKANYVEKYKQEGFKVMMAGDGVNDMLALKCADIGFGVDGGWGMDFVGPIDGVVQILEQGRACIVAGIAMIKIISVYAVVEYVCLTINAFLFGQLNNNHYMYLDFVLDIFPIVFLPMAVPKPLSAERPYSSILNFPTLLSIAIPIVATATTGMLLVYKQMYRQENIELNHQHNNHINKNNTASSVLFIIASGVICSTLISMDWKHTWRKENFVVIIYSLLGWALIHFAPFVNFLSHVFAMSPKQDRELMKKTLIITNILCVVLILIEKLVVFNISKRYALTSPDPVDKKQETPKI